MRLNDETLKSLLSGEYAKIKPKQAFRYLYSSEELLRFKAAEALGILAKSNARNYILRLFWLLSDESGAYCIGAPLAIAEIGRNNPDIFQSFKLKFLYLLENEEVERSYVVYGIFRNSEIYKGTEAKTLLEKMASKFRDQKFLAYSAMAIWKLGGEVSWILERISKVQIYDGKDFVELDGRGLRELIERELFYP